MALGKFDDFVAYLVRKADATLAKVKDNSIIGQMLAKADVSNYDRTLMSLEALYLALSTLSGNVTGDVFFVGKGGSDSDDGETWATRKLTVAAGYALCDDGDLLRVGPGTFTESLTFDTDGVTVIGAGIGAGSGIGGTIISGNTVFTCGANVFKDLVFYSVSGKTATVGPDENAKYNQFLNVYFNGASNTTSALHINGSGGASGAFTKVYKCRLNGGTSATLLLDTGGGASWGTFMKNLIEAHATGHGIHVNHASAVDNVFKGNVLNGNGSSGTGIYEQAGADNHFVNNSVEDFTTKLNIGANSYIIDGHEESQILAGNTIEKDLEAIYNAAGLVKRGTVDTATSTTVFQSDDLIEPFAGKYIGWWVTVEIDAGGTGAAPQGEWRQVSASTAAGAITHAAFTAQTALTDRIKLVPQEVYAATVIPGGAVTLQDLLDNQQAMLDLAEYPTISVVCDGNEQTVYEETGADVPFFFAGGFIDWTGANSGAGEDTTVKVYVKVDGTNYRAIYEEVFLAAAVPDPVATPFPRSVDTKPAPEGFYSKQDVKVTIQQAAEGGGWNTLDVRTIDAIRGG